LTLSVPSGPTDTRFHSPSGPTGIHSLTRLCGTWLPSGSTFDQILASRTRDHVHAIRRKAGEDNDDNDGDEDGHGCGNGDWLLGADGDSSDHVDVQHAKRLHAQCSVPSNWVRACVACER
jgi:hypothetical protein